jgi:hypothetical protein
VPSHMQSAVVVKVISNLHLSSSPLLLPRWRIIAVHCTIVDRACIFTRNLKVEAFIFIFPPEICRTVKLLNKTLYVPLSACHQWDFSEFQKSVAMLLSSTVHVYCLVTMRDNDFFLVQFYMSNIERNLKTIVDIKSFNLERN